MRVACLVPIAALKGDAAEMARKWGGEVVPSTSAVFDGAALVIDALFGAGLTRDLDGASRAIVNDLNLSSTRQAVLSVDVPSGVDGNCGAVRGVGVQANCTITFFRKKPGHLLMPGRALCGDVIVAGIGIADAVLGSPLSPSVPWTERGEGRSEGRQQTLAQKAAPHPNPLPVRTGERDDGIVISHSKTRRCFGAMRCRRCQRMPTNTRADMRWWYLVHRFKRGLPA